MALDPNWFYSTLAQSTAAIVGLGGGFLVQRLLQQRNEIAAPRAKLRSDLFVSYGDLNSRRGQAACVRDTMNNAIEEANRYDRDEFNAFEIRGDVHAFHHQLGAVDQSGLGGPIEYSELRKFEEAHTIAKTLTDALPANFEQYVDALAGGRLEAPPGAAWLDERPEAQPLAESETNVMRLLPYQRDIARRFWSQAKAVFDADVPKLAGFRDRLAPRRFYGLLVVIGALLAFGIVAPLSYLTARGGGSKGLLLIAFVILSFGFFVFIADELRRLRSAGDFKNESF